MTVAAATRHRALLIGNWSYADPDGKLLPLDGPEQDLEELRAALVDGDYGLFRDEDIETAANLTSMEIRIRIQQFIDSARRGDHLLLYYSGHGERLAEQELGFCGVDVRHQYRYAMCFNTTDIRSWLNKLGRASSTVIVLDCCFAGQLKGAAIEEQDVLSSLGHGIAVLASSGNQPTRAANGPGEASPFTAALARILRDPELLGHRGYLTVDHVYDALSESRLPTPPLRNVGATGHLALALRQPAEGEPDTDGGLRGWRDDVSFTTIDLHVGDHGTEVSIDDVRVAHPFSTFDSSRRAAVRRLSQLADAVIRQEAYSRDDRWRAAAQRALECAGENLFDTALPREVQHRVRGTEAGEGRTVLRLRLHFDTATEGVEQYPWEYLHSSSNSREPLGLRSGLLIQRCLPPLPGGGRRPALSGKTPRKVAVVNGFDAPFDVAGRRLEIELAALDTAEVVVHDTLAHATWNSLLDHVDDFEPDYLVLYLPVARNSRDEVQLGFATGSGTWDWRSPADLAGQLGDRVQAIALVTLATPPSTDCFRATAQFAHALATRTPAPVFFVSHQPGFERFFEALPSDRRASMLGLLIEALSRGKGVHRSFWYARSRFLRRLSEDLRPSFGVPGYYWRGVKNLAAASSAPRIASTPASTTPAPTPRVKP